MNFFFLHLYLNGSKYKVYMSQPAQLGDILKFFNYQNELVIIEYNGKIYNNSKTNSQLKYIKKNDKIEIITIVGGG